jgi:tetratricopeptide (TPR) repeat protein
MRKATSMTLRFKPLTLLACALVACGGGDDKRVVAPVPEVKPSAPAAPSAGGQVGAVDAAGSSGLTGTARARYEEGWKAWLNGDLQAAKTAFKDAQAEDSKSPAPSYALGVVLDRLGDASGAQQAYRAAYTANAEHEISMCAYALSLASSGKASEAEAFLSERRGKKPNSPRLATCNAELKSTTGDHAGAQQLAQDALRMDPDFKEAMVTIARDHYRARKLDLAKYALQAILEGFGEASPARDKENAEASLLRGLIFREGGARAVALADFEAAAKRRPDLVEALLNLGSMRLEAGNASGAKDVLESATRFAPTSAIAHLNLGDCYRLLGRYVEAKREFEQALSRDSSLAAAHYDLGLMFLTAPTIPGYSADGQVASAIKELETYRTMRGPKAPAGVQDDIDDLVARAKAKQAELKQTPAAAAAAPAPPPAPAATGAAPPKK